MKFVIIRGTNRQFYWHLTAANGRVIAQSEGYKAKQSVQKLLRKLSPQTPVEDQTLSSWHQRRRKTA